MRRIFVSFAALSLCVGWSPAGASGDVGCSPGWRLSHTSLGCDNMAMLGPGNDTRTNLALLLFDHRGKVPAPGKGPTPAPLGALFDWRSFAGWLSPGPVDLDNAYSSGEGSRCRSNDSGATAFAAAVNAAKLPGGEGAALVAARQGLKPDCAKPSDVTAIAALGGSIKSPAGKGFATYLSGAQAFYDGDFDAAAARFAALRDAGNPWLRETARYMAARVEVNRFQVGMFDEYGNPQGFEKVDQKAIAAADAGLRAYLKDYPTGAYAASATGLLRRVYWFGSKRGLLAAQYVAMFAQDPVARGLDDVDLAEEIDTKLLPDLKGGDTTDPTLLAILDLQRMRLNDDGSQTTDLLSLDTLNAQRGAFAKNPALFDYLVAAHSFYVAKKPADVLKLIPDAAKQPSFSEVQFSRQMLRGMALEAVKDRNARGFWFEMLPGVKSDPQHSALELAIAMHDERAGQLGRVFAPDSPVDDAMIRLLLLANVADADLLRQQARGAKAPREREAALFVLLYKQLSRGQYRGFLGDLALIPASAKSDGILDLGDEQPLPLGYFASAAGMGDFGCPAIKRVATDLSAAPQNARARICLAEFIRERGFDTAARNGVVSDESGPNDLAGTPELFAGPVYSRLEVYKSVIADAAATPDDRAYALYRAVNCYAPSGGNSCGGTEVDKNQRKAWFQRLKTQFPKTRWASDLRYYW